MIKPRSPSIEVVVSRRSSHDRPRSRSPSAIDLALQPPIEQSAGGMDGSNELDLHDVRAVFRAVGELRELRASEAEWRAHMVDTMCRLVSAKAGMSCQSALPLDYPPRIKPSSFVSGWTRPEQDLWELASKTGLVEMNPTTRTARAMGARSFTAPRHHLADDRAWYRSDYVQGSLRAIGVDDHVISTFRLGHGATVDALALYKPWGAKPFTEREVALVRLFHEEVGWYLEREDAAWGKVLPFLSPRLKEILEYLLTGENEKQIAAHLALSVHTVHSYVKDLYRKLGVTSRGELLARFITERPRPHKK